MSDEISLPGKGTVERLVAESGIDLPPEYLNFLGNRHDYVLELEAGRFEIYRAEQVLEANREFCVEELLPGFLVFGDDGGNELPAFDLREPKPRKIYMVPKIVMSEADAVLIADDFESLVRSEKIS